MKSSIQKKLWSLCAETHIQSAFLVKPGKEVGEYPFLDYFNKPYEEYFLELGSGWGEVILELASLNPNIGYLAMERKWNRILQTEKEIRKRNIGNLILSGINFQWFINDVFPSEFFGTVLLNFPDPWPKRKHHKNRAINPEFLNSIHRILKPGGRFYFATDHCGYFRHSLRLFRKSRFFIHNDKEWNNQGYGLPVSEFEKQTKREGRKVFYLERVKV